MYLHDAIRSLVGAPNLLCFRVAGPILRLSRHNQVVDYRGPQPRRFVGCFSDFVALDWQVIDAAEFAAIMAKAAQERAAAAAGGEDGEGNGG